MESVKPGWKTSEAWFALAANIVGFLLVSGIFADGSIYVRLLGMAAMVLSSLGYGYQRSTVKAAVSNSNAATTFAVASNPPKPPTP